MREGDDLYFDISKDEKDRAIRFLLDAVIRSRGNCGFPSNTRDYDEDVNIYLAHLLFAISTSTYQKLVQKYLAVYESDLLNLVEHADDNYIRYFIYKINADNLLIHLSLFQDFMKKMNQRKQIYIRTEQQFCEAARIYYEQAALYNQRIYRKKTAIGEVLRKLAKNFDLYCSVLQVTRKDFFHFANRFKDLEFTGFVEHMNRYEKDALIKEKQDAFLDLYHEWMKDKGNTDLAAKINQLCEQISQLDPNFKFRLN